MFDLIVMTMHFHHIGIAVFSIEETKRFYLWQGYKASEVVYDPVQNVNICFVEKTGEPLLELIEPHDETSPVNDILRKSGVGAYHNCYEVEDMDEAIRELRLQRFVVVRKPEVAVALNNRRVSFLYNKNVGLVELVSE